MRFLLLLPLLILAAPAQEPPVDTAPQATQEENPFAGLEFQTGSIQLPKKVARLTLPEGYRYLNASDTRMVLEQVPHGPPAGTKGIQGMVIPPNVAPGRAAGWLALLVYSEDGHIAEDQITGLNPALYMSHLKSLNAEENKKLKAKGEPAYELVEESSSPRVWGSKLGSGSLRYSPATKVFSIEKRYWNERAPNGEREKIEQEHWALGRRGVIVIRAFSVAGGTAAWSLESEKIAEMIQFTAGNRHEDFNSQTDKRGSLLPVGVELAAAGTEVKQGISRALLRKLPWLLVIGVALLLKRWIDKMREA